MDTQEVQAEEIALGNNEALQRLYKNKDFKKLVVVGYMEQGSISLMRNLSKVKEEYKPLLIDEIEARSKFAKYLSGIEEDANSILEARSL